MLVAGWSLTKACNLNCIHCYNASGKRDPNELNLEECIKVVDKLYTSGVVAVNFGGGECALRPDFLDLCRYIKEKNIAISYTTNGTTFNRIKDNLNLFHDIGVSLDFADSDRHDWFRGKKEVYGQAIEALEYLVKEKIDNEIVTCLTHLNCSEEELKKMYELADRIGVDYWRLNRFRANGRGIGNKSELALSKEELKIAYTFLNKYPRNEILTPEPLFRAAFGGNYYLPGDPSGFTAFRIQPNGEVSPSVFLSESGGNIKYKTINEILDSNIFKKIRDRNPKGKCRTCEAYSHCKGGDAGASFLEYGHFDGPDPLCWLEPNEINRNVQQKLERNWNVHELYLCTLYVPVRRKNESP